MFPDFARMDAAIAATLAQVVPVLMLTLLFEVRARRRPTVARQSRLAIAFGFLGNLTVASLALLDEFTLLSLMQTPGENWRAGFAWWVSLVLFVLVTVRWAATTALAQLVAAQGPAVRSGIAAYRDGVSEGLAELARSPSLVIADAVELLGESTKITWREVGLLFRGSDEFFDALRDAFRSVPGVFFGALIDLFKRK
ncbi:hypothetical protein [Curtobacterium aurantiacum]|uniref:hypothetical protein n=1 Tax=Curtobacterium aurantiacum TaxID=3236919 RepID=UPI001BDE1E73|nr:hypothetical protein [Curtobacterium flaccumfaciens]MBT1679547.1 hypothetical protein [Curtobacterium flaccumfaciens pv. flaccumfaciens]